MNMAVNMDFDMSQSSGAMANRPTGKLMPRFYMESVRDGLESRRAGRDVFRQAEFIEITFAQSGGQTIVRQVRPEDKVQFADHYNAFKRNMSGEFTGSGMHVDQWAVLNKSQADMLKNMGIHTVENIAEMTEDQLILIGAGAQNLKHKAATWLKIAQDSSEAMRAVEAAEDLDRQKRALEEENAILRQRIAQSNAIAQAITKRGSALPADEIQGLAEKFGAGDDADILSGMHNPHEGELSNAAKAALDSGFGNFGSDEVVDELPANESVVE